jgi:hypothetical protein
VVEGARLESVYRGNSIEGSNPSLSATQSMVVEHDDPILQFIAKAANPALCNSVLPWTLIARSHASNSARAQEFEHSIAEFLIAIKDDIVVGST